MSNELKWSRSINDIGADMLRTTQMRRLAERESKRLQAANKRQMTKKIGGRVGRTPVEVNGGGTKVPAIRFAIPIYGTSHRAARLVAYRAASSWKGVQ